jgi:hypothetical protein
VSPLSRRIRPVLALRVPFVAALALVCGAQSARAADPSLYVTFHLDHSITMTLADGTPVGTTGGSPTVVPPGPYNVYVDDAVGVSGPECDLSGPGVSLAADNYDGESVLESYREIFQPNSAYTWRNHEQPGVVFVFTTSGAVSSSPPSSSSGETTSGGPSPGQASGKPSQDVVGSALVPFRGTLNGTVSAAGKLTLTSKGKGVSTLKAGRYTIAVTDMTPKSGFIVQEIRRQAMTVTGVSFVGKRSVTVELKAGQWMFYSAAGKKSYFIVLG